MIVRLVWHWCDDRIVTITCRSPAGKFFHTLCRWSRCVRGGPLRGGDLRPSASVLRSAALSCEHRRRATRDSYPCAEDASLPALLAPLWRTHADHREVDPVQRILKPLGEPLQPAPIASTRAPSPLGGASPSDEILPTQFSVDNSRCISYASLRRRAASAYPGAA
jgi:hypothetical protein